MSHKQEIMDAADKILQLNKTEWTPAEFAILIQSKYYNIEELFTFGANYQEDNIDIKIKISEEIVDLCCSFEKNIEQYPEMLSWKNRDEQVARDDGIYEEVNNALQLQRAIKMYQDDPTPFNAMRLKMFGNI